MRILAVDIGTSSVKAGVVNERGELNAWVREGLAFDSSGGESIGLAQRWLTAISSMMRRLTEDGPPDAVVLSGNGPTIVPVGRDGTPSGPVLLWIDTRALRVGDAASFFLPKIAWFREHHPREYEATRRCISCPEYVAFALTGEAVTVCPSEEFRRYIWDNESVASYGIPGEMLPPMAETGTEVGRVTHEAAAKFGLPPGTPVHVGGSDFLMCLLGTATVVPGRTCDRAGTSEGINYCSETWISDQRLRTLPHVIPGRYNVAGILSSTGRLFEWFRRISGQQDKSYDKMLEEVAGIGHDAGTPVFLPSLHSGATWEFSGAAFMGLEPHHGIDHMGRALVESIGFSIRDLLETLDSAGCRVEELRVSGGQARNRVWNQMKADIIGRAITVPRIVDAELLGNAAACLVTMGAYGSLVEAAEHLYRGVRTYEPRPEEHKRFAEQFNRFREFRSRVVIEGGVSYPGNPGLNSGT